MQGGTHMKGIERFKPLVFVAAFLVGCIFLSLSPKTCPINISDMPLVIEGDPELSAIWNAPPVEQRGEEYAYWLQGSFKINVRGASGSGTLCAYDPSTNTAWVISCGHLWNGTRSAQDIRNNPISGVTITTWYQNENKLASTRDYEAVVHFYSNEDGYDVSLLSFHPDWVPDTWYPIAMSSYPVQKGMRLHSMGCDGGREVAHYDVEVVGIRNNDLITQYNSPRPGRSGGGLVDDAGYYVGICWGTSVYSGEGIGYFTPLTAIHTVFQREGFGFLLNQPLPNWARRIPIFDHGSPGQYPPNYIPLPGGRI